MGKAGAPLFAEILGTLFLLMIVVGSGIMGEKLSPSEPAIALLANSIATGAGLYVLISIFGPISGAHFNPVVSLCAWLNKEITLSKASLYILTQVSGAILGVWFTHIMFGLPVIQTSETARNEIHLYFSEFIATFGLLLTIGLLKSRDPARIAQAVALYITAAYWFTSSTSFANPAVTIARSMTHTFSGIAPSGLLGFMVAQVLGGILAIKVSNIFRP